MPNFRMPRVPKFVAPKSMKPEDVLGAAVETQHDIYNALVKEPISRAGATPPPEIPTPEMVLQQLTAGMKPPAGFPAGFPGTSPFGAGGSPSSGRGSVGEGEKKSSEHTGRGSL